PRARGEREGAVVGEPDAAPVHLEGEALEPGGARGARPHEDGGLDGLDRAPLAEGHHPLPGGEAVAPDEALLPPAPAEGHGLGPRRGDVALPGPRTGWAGGLGVSPIVTAWAGGLGVSPIVTAADGEALEVVEEVLVGVDVPPAQEARVQSDA